MEGKENMDINVILKLFIKPTGSHIINDCIRSIKSTYHRFLAFLGSDHSTTTASKVNLFGAKTGHILGMRFGTKEDFLGML